MARFGRLLIAVILVCLATRSSWSTLARPEWISTGNDPERGWARGPVWYIMTNAEYASYRRLPGETERRRFIRKFWDLRDPLPDTPDNELEREFWRRVATADGHFGQEIKPGWKTERGKVFIMLGPPENVEADQILADRTGSSSWVYDLGGMSSILRQVLRDALALPEDRRVVKIKVREESEGTRSTARGLPSRSSVLRPTESLPLAEMLVRRMKGEAEPLRYLGQVMRVPEAMEPPARVHVSTVFEHVPMRARVDFRPAPGSAEGRRTAVAITLGVSFSDLERAGVTSSDPSRSIMRGHLTSVDEPSRVYPLTGAHASDPHASGTVPSGDMAFQAVVLAPAGRYILDVAFEDLSERVMGALRDVIQVPDFGEAGMSLSSLVLAARLDHVDDGPGSVPPDLTPFAFGPYRVIPRTSDLYAQGEQLTVFYRAYGALRNERGLPNLDITYQFYIEDGARWLPVGAPIMVDGAGDVEQAWSVPLEGWPAGNYRLEVTVVDRLSGAASVRGARFGVAQAGSPAPPSAPQLP